MATNFKILDPVQGLIDYVNDIKPYHSKVIEALIEYVGTDTIDVSVFEEFNFDIELLYEFDGNYVCLMGGYGTPSFGDPENLLVLSPDASQTVLEYPAIGPGFFIVLGDKSDVFDPAANLDLSIESFVEEKILAVTASTGSPPSGGAFTVLGDKTTEYPIGTNFSVTGSAFNDGDYIVATSLLQGSPASTKLVVNQVVPTINVEGFVRVIDPTNTGIFSVIGSEYNGSHLRRHTTVFITGISLVTPTLTDTINQRYVSYVNTQPLEYTEILSYSKALRLYDATSPSTPYFVADEGTVIANIVNLTSTSFSVLGNFESSNLFVDDTFIVSDSSGNNGTYTIISLVYEFDAIVDDFVTTFEVASVPDINIDGNINMFIPSNVLIIDNGDYTRFYVQGTRVNITTGSHVGNYTTLRAWFVDNKTYIRVRETLINEGHGILILSTGANYIVVDGDVSSTYVLGQQFNIVGSTRNDGSYTTTSSVYVPTSNTTQIVIAEPFDITDISGEIHVFNVGDIVHLPEGFGATLDLCELVPKALSSATFTEHFDLLLGHKFIIDGTDSATNKIYIQDNVEADVYNIFLAGSPPDTTITITSSGPNNGDYTITDVTSDPGVHAILTIAGSPALADSGIFTNSPVINGGFLLYKNWFQYFIVNIDVPGNDFLVAGDATTDITNGMSIQMVYPENTYTVNSSPTFDGTNTTISVTEVIITAGSPPVDGWIMSV